MNIQDFKFYRKNNRYYFESDLLEGRVFMKGKMLKGISIENEGCSPFECMRLEDKENELFDLFNENIAAVLAAEEL